MIVVAPEVEPVWLVLRFSMLLETLGAILDSRTIERLFGPVLADVAFVVEEGVILAQDERRDKIEMVLFDMA